MAEPKESMGWEMIVALIIKEGIEVGLPLAEALFKKWSSGDAPTAADFTELRAIASLKAVDHVKGRLAAMGIPLDDPRAAALLALVK